MEGSFLPLELIQCAALVAIVYICLLLIMEPIPRRARRLTLQEEREARALDELTVLDQTEVTHNLGPMDVRCDRCFVLLFDGELQSCCRPSWKHRPPDLPAAHPLARFLRDAHVGPVLRESARRVNSAAAFAS